MKKDPWPSKTPQKDVSQGIGIAAVNESFESNLTGQLFERSEGLVERAYSIMISLATRVHSADPCDCGYLGRLDDGSIVYVPCLLAGGENLSEASSNSEISAGIVDLLN